MASLPMRGEWIEISAAVGESIQTVSLPMRGEWIEIAPDNRCGHAQGLSPCGESGLKYGPELRAAGVIVSLPMRGEWIEMLTLFVGSGMASRLSPCGESGLKSQAQDRDPAPLRLSPCGESGLKCTRPDRPVTGSPVSPHAGRVD